MFSYVYFSHNENDLKNVGIGLGFGPCIVQKVLDLYTVPKELAMALGSKVDTHSIVFEYKPNVRFYYRNWNECLEVHPEIKDVWSIGPFKLKFEKPIAFPFLSYTKEQVSQLLERLEYLCQSAADEEMVLIPENNFDKNGLWTVNTVLERGEPKGALVFEFV